jgi:hypothetical protein
MAILFRVITNSCNTQVIQFIPHSKCSVGDLWNICISNIMHFIYFFADNLNAVIKPLINALVHRKEKC